MEASRPIGIFDSGVGGFTVAKAVMEALPGESIVYLGDTGRVPYGGKDQETILRYAYDSVSFLMQQGAKLVIMACNTSSALALPLMLRRFPIPLLGVLEPGARVASRETRSGNIGVLSTQATADSHAYREAIYEYNSLAQVTEVGCPGWVEAIEAGMSGDHEKLLHRYVDPLVEAGVDTVILGCTHYPLIRDQLEPLFAARRTTFVDPAKETAIVAKKILTEGRNLNPTGQGDLSLFYTKESPQFVSLARRLFADETLEVTHVQVDGIGHEAYRQRS